jgi:hypothetical protein
VPPELQQLLGSHPDLVDVVIERVLPERKIPFDGLRGEPRNADLAIAARDRSGIVALTIEGKADESFDRPVSAILEAAARRLPADERTGAIPRIQALSAALFRPWRKGLAHLGELRYQLLTGIAGTMAWAREIGASRAVFGVHEFVTDQTRDEKHARNAADLKVVGQFEHSPEIKLDLILKVEAQLTDPAGALIRRWERVHVRARIPTICPLKCLKRCLGRSRFGILPDSLY